jgi:capsular polysaccharide biosynthesis protein
LSVDLKMAVRVMVAAVVLAAVTVTSASLMQQPEYAASAQILLGWEQEGPWQTPEYQELPAPMIMRAIGSRGVAKEAIQRLGLQTAAAELLDNLTVEQVEGTQFIRLTYEDTNPERAKQIVNTVGQVSSEFISERSSQLTATVWEKAAVPESPVSPRPLRNGLLTLVLGLVLWVGFLFIPATRTSGERIPRQRLATGYSDHSEAERIKEKELLRALGRRGKLTAVEAALETGLSVDEASRILEELAFAGHLEVTVEHGRLYYAFWGDRGEDRA